ncbi:MAG TPA: DUF554 domain-containing protein [Syntrophales bacterium]|nr:DUF554 domain-containing protein [Syntrophales bacterium]
MTGTIVNTGAVVAGSLIGLAAGKRLPERMKKLLLQCLGLSTLLIGLQMALSGKELMAVIACLLLGAIIGEGVNLERWIERLGEWLKTKARSGSSTFVEGFVTSSLLYVTGAMVIVGSIQDGVAGDPRTLYIKAMLDGVASIALASTLGPGVLFSALSVFAVQGSLTLLASRLVFLQAPAVLDAVTATGGLLIVAIGINLLELTKIRIGNLIPALVLAILWGAWK